MSNDVKVLNKKKYFFMMNKLCFTVICFEIKRVFGITNVLREQDPVQRKQDLVLCTRDPVLRKRDPVPCK